MGYRTKRRTRQAVETLRQRIIGLLVQEHPMTVRQLFYRLVSLGSIAKTESEYKNTVCRLTAQLRREGVIPYTWIADETRWVRRPRTFGGLRELFAEAARAYRRRLWDEAPVYVEVWLEKDALAGVIVEVTEAWDVPLYVCRGYPSLSFLHGAAETLKIVDKPAILYYLGDWDPSGVDIARLLPQRLRELGALAVRFERLAVTPAQVQAWQLPTRPTKTTDSRARRFAGDSVELDAIPPDRLRSLVEEAIRQHLDPDQVERLRRVEAAERETLLTVLATWPEEA